MLQKKKTQCREFGQKSAFIFLLVSLQYTCIYKKKVHWTVQLTEMIVPVVDLIYIACFQTSAQEAWNVM